MIGMKRVLMYVYIDTHFVELLRIAELLGNSGRYEVVFFFEYHYSAIERDLKAAKDAGFACLDKSGSAFDSEKPADVPTSQTPNYILSPATSLNNDLDTSFLAKVIDFGLRFKCRHPKLYRSTAFAVIKYTARLYIKCVLLARRVSTFLRIFCSHFSWRQLASRISPELPILIAHYRNQIRLTNKLVAEIQPDVVILPEANIAYATAALTRAAHNNGVGVVIVPFTIANATELAEAYWHNPDFSMGPKLNRFVATLFPKWVLLYKGRKILPARGAQIIATEFFRLAPPLPWIINSGDADVIAVESERMQEYYIEAGLPESKLVATGALSDDILSRGIFFANTRRASLYAELGLTNDLPLLLCALTPDQIRAGREGCDFISYTALVDFWLSNLAKVKNFNVVIRLHPRMKIEDYWFIEDYGIKVAAWDTADLIPLCDIYVASVSATIRWAIACGKPVINYDVYRFRYQDFSQVKGVITIEEKHDFTSVLSRLTNDLVYYEEVASAQRQEAKFWSHLDGKSGERMLSLIDSFAI